TDTPIDTPTATRTSTNTPTATPTAEPRLVGHVTWQGRPQPDPCSAIAVTLTLRMQTGGAASEYTGMTTDASGYLTVPVGSLPGGDYYWRVKGPKYLATSGSLTLVGAPLTNVEMGTQLAGDTDDDNQVDADDWTTMRATYGKAHSDPGYDDRADFNGNLVVNV